jgi:hypothetical protein
VRTERGAGPCGGRSAGPCRRSQDSRCVEMILSQFLYRHNRYVGVARSVAASRSRTNGAVPGRVPAALLVAACDTPPLLTGIPEECSRRHFQSTSLALPVDFVRVSGRIQIDSGGVHINGGHVYVMWCAATRTLPTRSAVERQSLGIWRASGPRLPASTCPVFRLAVACRLGGPHSLTES